VPILFFIAIAVVIGSVISYCSHFTSLSQMTYFIIVIVFDPLSGGAPVNRLLVVDGLLRYL
jgi:hypothetical protein